MSVVVTAVQQGDLRILLVQGARPSWRWRWALPGGLLKRHELLEHAAARVVGKAVMTGGRARHLQQIGAYDDRRQGRPHPGRRRVVTVAYWAIVGPRAEPWRDARAGDAPVAGYREFVPVPEIEDHRVRLASDQGRIVADTLDELRSSLEARSIAGCFCPSEFTLAQLREVYEAAWGTRLDPGNFQRKVRSEGLLAPLERRSKPSRRGRPARLWRAPELPARTSKPMFRMPFSPTWRTGEADEDEAW